MSKAQRQQKEQLKKALLQEIDRYYEEMTEGLQDIAFSQTARIMIY